MTEKKKKDDKVLNIYQRMNAAQKQVTYVQKNKPNGMKYSIVSHDDVTAKVRGPLVELGVIYYPVNMSWEQVGNRTQVFLQLKFCNIDDKDDFMLVDCLGYGIDAQDKGPGKAVSYAVKYGLLKAMGLKTGDDADLDSIDHKEEESVKEKKPKGSHKMDQDMRVFIQEIMRSTSMEEFEDVKSQHKERLEEVVKAWPDYMKTFDGERTISYNDQIKEHKARIQKQEEMDDLQAKEMEPPQ